VGTLRASSNDLLKRPIPGLGLAVPGVVGVGLGDGREPLVVFDPRATAVRTEAPVGTVVVLDELERRIREAVATSLAVGVPSRQRPVEDRRPECDLI